MEKVSGSFTMLGGAVSLVGAVAAGYAGQWGTAIKLGISGLSSLLGGLGLVIETTEERINRLTKESETLSNTAK